MTEESDSIPADPSDLDPEQLAELEAAMAEARERLLSVPPETVVLNHVMGLYELGAIHMSSTPPNLHGATLAIDSMALLVDGLGDRLGPEASTMRDALANIRMAYVAVSSASPTQDGDPGAASAAADSADGETAGDDDSASS